MRRGLFVLGMSLAVLTVACRGGDDAPATDAPCTNEATAEAIVETNRSGRVDPKAFRAHDDEIQCRLRRALIAPDELGSGWTSQLGGLDHLYDADRRHAAVCRVPVPSFIAGLRAIYNESSASGSLTLMHHEVRLVEPGDAARYMDGLRHSCPLVAKESEGDDGFRFVDVPTYGDDSIALVEDLRLGGDEEARTAAYVVVREGDVLTIAVTAPGDEQAARELLARVGPKIGATGPIPEPTPFEGEGCGAKPTPVLTSDDDDLRRALLSINDLPFGWVERGSAACDTLLGDTTLNCSNNNRSGEQLPEPTARIEAHFLNARDGFTEVLGRFAEGDAQRHLDLAIELAVSFDCTVTSGATSMHVRFTPFPSPRLGDGTVTLRASFEELVAYRSVTRVGSLVVITTFVTPKFEFTDDGDRIADETFSEDGLPLVRRAVEKLQALD